MIYLVKRTIIVLILTRKTNESLVIDDQIVITILELEGERVKIGISAPREITIHRKELWDAINEQNQIAENLAKEEKPDKLEELRRFLASEINPENEPIP
ncbi:MAG: carbon storage regulator CsrA [Anaerolineales bacterium]